jgi:hypothetical protein
VAYAIAQQGGFAPSAGFSGDPDHERAARWYAALAPKPAD